MTDPAASLDLLRRQIAALLSKIDTAALPPPDRVHPPRHKRRGAEWQPCKGWRIFTLDDPDGAGVVYVDHICDDLSYAFGAPDDWEALRIEDARCIGLAYLAAAERAEQRLTGVARLDAFRRDDSDPPDHEGEEATVRRFSRPTSPRRKP